jgi:hypothetical protein
MILSIFVIGLSPPTGKTEQAMNQLSGHERFVLACKTICKIICAARIVNEDIGEPAECQDVARRPEIHSRIIGRPAGFTRERNIAEYPASILPSHDLEQFLVDCQSKPMSQCP